MGRTVSNPGRTALFYRRNLKSRLKHIADNSNGGKHDKPAKYQQRHQEYRRKHNTPPDEDAVTQPDGSLANGPREKNRADGGRKGAARRMAKKKDRLKIA